MTQSSHPAFAPLATAMRPTDLEQFIGQTHLLAPGKPLRLAIESGALHSMILWGPPGVGKTTLANLMANQANAQIERISAVLAGVKDIRDIVARAKLAQQAGQATILFVDEVHRFNKSQQDAFLPHVEDGTITLIGATTENPSFQLNNALLSRARVYVLKSLNNDELLQVLDQALTDSERGLGARQIHFPLELRRQLIAFADGDARQCLNLLEIVSDFFPVESAEQQHPEVTADLLKEVLSHSVRRFDNGGEEFYNQISALHKSVRGSNPDAALYWLARMLDGGCDPAYVARRITRMASEDIGNADPRGLSLALNAWEAYERLGSPEGELALAQAVAYLACAPKSNAVYSAAKAAWRDAKEQGSLEVPLHLRNAPTALMKKLEYGKEYRYAHDEANAYAAGESYFPEQLGEQRYYYPVDRGLEIKIKAKLDVLRKLDQKDETE